MGDVKHKINLTKNLFMCLLSIDILEIIIPIIFLFKKYFIHITKAPYGGFCKNVISYGTNRLYFGFSLQALGTILPNKPVLVLLVSLLAILAVN